ncbi:DUF2163 domain-containing protein [Puniceibacterium sediminis]|uniref:Bacteriophage phiJL001 Gp84 C-terminal domain-containing protein n=1 Tax=Puniceibacterium sediminis TaxID=1608407 RepID=A0A238XQQ9_9RHOB|nr:DUF2163 domain-containing protein [Puniceibacterium sediminis]SNR60793.1 phage conserved hypothetical protein BR0599 [Puniceibacterium sediminis]
MALSPEFAAHLASGLTTVARAWSVSRTDGAKFGFTDHDVDLAFDGLTFRADTGLSAMALEQGTGLSVDNTEAMGALCADAITEADIAAGRYDNAEVVAWLVNWADVAQREIQFRGTIGEIRRSGGAFQAELRGLSEALNRPNGRVFQKPCTAVLGDSSCGLDLADPGYFHAGAVVAVEGKTTLIFDLLEEFSPDWFLRGRVMVQSGTAQGLSSPIKRDHVKDGQRRIELWEPLRADLVAGDLVRLEAGCDKRFDTCRKKFHNVLNFQGFPDLPEDDWQMATPSRVSATDSGSRR